MDSGRTLDNDNPAHSIWVYRYGATASELLNDLEIDPLRCDAVLFIREWIGGDHLQHVLAGSQVRAQAHASRDGQTLQVLLMIQIQRQRGGGRERLTVAKEAYLDLYLRLASGLVRTRIVNGEAILHYLPLMKLSNGGAAS